MLEKIRQFIIDSLMLDIPELTEDTAFKDLGLDSLDEVEMVMNFEDQYGVQVPDEELEKIKTVGDFIKCLEKLGISE